MIWKKQISLTQGFSSPVEPSVLEQGSRKKSSIVSEITILINFGKLFSNFLPLEDLVRMRFALDLGSQRRFPIKVARGITEASNLSFNEIFYFRTQIILWKVIFTSHRFDSSSIQAQLEVRIF